MLPKPPKLRLRKRVFRSTLRLRGQTPAKAKQPGKPNNTPVCDLFVVPKPEISQSDREPLKDVVDEAPGSIVSTKA